MLIRAHPPSTRHSPRRQTRLIYITFFNCRLFVGHHLMPLGNKEDEGPIPNHPSIKKELYYLYQLCNPPPCEKLQPPWYVEYVKLVRPRSIGVVSIQVSYWFDIDMLNLYKYQGIIDDMQSNGRKMSLLSHCTLLGPES